jgi:STE24 endopeptidase
MPFLLLFLLTLTCLQPEWPRPPEWLGESGCVIVTWAGVALLWLWASLLTRRCRRRLLQNPGHRHDWMRRFAAGRGNHFFALLGFFLAALFLGWGWIIKSPEATDRPIPGLELVLLAPMVLGLIGSWALFYPMERAAHEVYLYPESAPFLGRWAYVGLQARHNLLLVVPPLTLIIVHQVLFGLFPGLGRDGEVLPLSGALLVLAFLTMPLLLRVFLGLRPMPKGQLRDRLEVAARRLRFRYSDILVWNTEGTVANAMVTGVIPWVRYIVVTDKLVGTLTAEEIEGVFGHEVGHIKHHHMFFYILFMVTSLVALGGLAFLGESLIEQSDVKTWLMEAVPGLFQLLDSLKFYALLPVLVLFAIYLFVVFGYLSRRCERQADIYGCRGTTPQAFIDALEKVAALNGIPRDKPGWLWSWQHGTVGQRVAFLEQLKQDPAVEPRFQRRLLFLKWGVVLFMVVISAGVLVSMKHLLGPEKVSDFWRQLL